MKFNLNSDDNLLLNKTIEILVMTIVVRAVSHENNECYSQVFFEECLYKLQKRYIMIELTFLEQLMPIKQAHQKSVIFATIGISQTIVLCFNQMSATNVMIY